MILLIFFIFIVIVIFLKKLNIENFTSNKLEIPNAKRPYVNVYDDKGNKLNVILISKPFLDKKNEEFYKKNKDTNIFLGISSYLEFPNKSSNPFDNKQMPHDKKEKYLEMCEGWIHGFRNPDIYFPKGVPLLLASESDWINCNNIKPNSKIEKIYDFVYICLKQNEKKDTCDDWATYNKNWTLAKKCLKIFCVDFKLKGLLIGRKGCELPNGCSFMETTNILPHKKLQEMYQKSKFIFLPNQKDASPRVLTEALATDLPCLVNKNILGGWKYVNKDTGEFFTNENDIKDSLTKLLENIKNKSYSPRKYFINNYSIINSGKRLKEFIYKHWKDRINIPESKVKYITPAHASTNFVSCNAVKN